MNSTNKTIGVGILAVVIIVLLGYFALQERQVSTAGTPGIATTTEQTSTSTGQNVAVSPAGGTQISGGYTITPVTAPTAPNYKTPLSYSASVDATTRAQDQSQFAAVQTALASNPTSYPAWLELGILRESTGDYAGAAADWKYTAALYPTDATVLGNLGDLYANYLHESSQGIAYYKQAIKADPTTEETLYDNLAQIYLAEGDKADAKATLQQGISAHVVGYQNLQNELNSMQ